MDDNQLTKANSQLVFHGHEKPFHMVHSTHPQQKQDRPIYGVVLVMEEHAFSLFLKHNCPTDAKYFRGNNSVMKRRLLYGA